MKIAFIPIGAALSLITAPLSHAQDNAAHDRATQLSIASWAKLGQIERQIMIMAALEGLIIASTDSTAAAPPFDVSCLVQNSPAEIEMAMLQMKNHYPEQSVIDVYLAITKCHISMAETQ